MPSSENPTNPKKFDPFAKEKELRRESATWDTSNPEQAVYGDIPLIDLTSSFTGASDHRIENTALEIRQACEEVGFFSVVGHGISAHRIASMFDKVRQFHKLPIELKQSILMDRPEWPIGGVGYLPIKNRKLPARNSGNLNEAFIIKSDHVLGMDDNQWPEEEALTGFRSAVTQYAEDMEALGKRMLPLFALALDMPVDFSTKAFDNPTWRLRMTHYPAMDSQPDSEYGIAPHVDTTFCTILAQDRAGLTIFDERQKKWLQAPLLDNAFIVNSGELLRQWTNDRFLSVKHFANNNTGNVSRYSIPFFLNANANYPMTCIPSCCGPDNPAKYPTISYAESQAVAQGE